MFHNCQCSCKNPTIERDKTNIRLAANAFDALSPEEQELANRDIYGDNEPLQETPEFIKQKLQELEQELLRMPESSTIYYKQALAQEEKLDGREYVGSEAFQLMFLRSDLYNAKATARRIAVYFKEKHDNFGPEKLSHRIQYTDLTQDEQRTLVSGAMTYIGTTDDSGRPILLFRRAKLLRTPVDCLKRLNFYIVTHLLETNPVAQTRGIIAIEYNLDGTMPTPVIARRLFSVLHMAMVGLPLRISGFHNYYQSPRDHLVINMMLVVIPKHVRARFIAHRVSSHVEIQYQILRYGIHFKDLPISSEDGRFQYDKIRSYWEKQRQLEECS